MPTPAAGVTNRHELGWTYMDIDLLAQAMGYVGLELMPWYGVALQAGNYKRVKLKSLLRKVDLDTLRRQSDGSYVRDSWEYEDDNYATVEYGKEEAVDDRAASILAVAGGIAADQIAADRSMWMTLAALEQDIAGKVFDATIPAAQRTAVTNAWSDATNGKPITDVKDEITEFENANGFGPNTIVLNAKVARNALTTDQVQKVLGYRPTEGLRQEPLLGNLSEQVLAQVWGVPRVLIAGGYQNTAQPGVTPTLSRIWGDNVALLYCSGGADLKVPCFGRTFGYTGDGAGLPFVIEQYRDEKIRSEVIRARMDLHAKIIHSTVHHLLTGV